MGASGSWRHTGEKRGPSWKPLEVDREDRRGKKIKDELVNPWPWFAACCLLLYTMLLFPHQHVRACEELCLLPGFWSALRATLP